jgi:DNA-binding transcriptional LysR family regulator
MILTQLNAFVLVARLGSVRAAAAALGVSESADSQAITCGTLLAYSVRR